jgi:hypothetical protein
MTSPQRYPTNDELDYERRAALGFPGLGVPGNDSKGVVTDLQTQFAVEGNETANYIGVTPDRMTYANSTEQPLAAAEGVELTREERLVTQEVLVAPATPAPEGKQTGGGGSSQETIYTATSGERFSATIANPPTTETVSADETTAGPADEEGNVEVGTPGGSSGETVSDAAAEETQVAPEASSSVAQTETTEEDTDSETPTAAAPTPPTPSQPAKRGKATSTTSNAAESS